MALAAGFDPAADPSARQQQDRGRAPLRVRGRRRPPDPRLLRRDRAGRAAARPSPERALIRVTPGIKPSTHDYVQTGQLDSKFGFGLEDGLAERAVERVRASQHLELVGLHAHIGSQIFELEPYVEGDRGDRRLLRRRRPRARAAQRRRRPRDRLPRRRRAALDRGLRRRQGARRPAGLRPGAADPGRARAARWSATPASPRTGSGRSRRSRACAPTSPSTAGCPTTCGRCSTAPATRP